MVWYHFRMTCLDLVPINPQPLNGFVRLATCSIFFPGSFHFRIKWLPVCHMVHNNPTTILMTLDWNWRNRNCTLGYCNIVCPTVEASAQQDGDRPIWKPLFCIGSCICSGLPTGASCLVSAERNGLLGTCPTAQWKKQGYHPLQVVFLGRTLDATIPQIPFPNQNTDGSIILVLILPITCLWVWLPVALRKTWAEYCWKHATVVDAIYRHWQLYSFSTLISSSNRVLAELPNDLWVWSRSYIYVDWQIRYLFFT